MRRILALGTMMLISGWSLSASAQDPVEDDGDTGGSSDTILPLPQAARPLVSPAMTFRADFTVPILNFSLATGLGTFSETFVGIPWLGVGASVTDWLQIDATIIPIVVTPNGAFGNPQLGATVAFTENDADVEIGARLAFVIPAGDNRAYAMPFGVPFRFHLVDDMLRIDTGVYFALTGNSGGGDPAFGLAWANTSPINLIAVPRPGIPAEFTVSIIDNVFARAGTGFGIFDFTGNASNDVAETIFIPLGFGAGANIPLSREMVVDASFDFGFPTFATPGSSGDKINSNLWEIGINGSFHYSIE